MNTEPSMGTHRAPGGRRRRVPALLSILLTSVALLGATLDVTAQTAPAPAPAQSAPAQTAPAPANSPGGPTLVPPIGGSAAPAAGSGQGFHSPQSAFPQLQELPGVLSWGVLGGVTVKQEGKKSVPVFPPQVASLAGRKVKVQGFMLPLQPGERQSHFLLSAVPTTCSFCMPAGPEGIVEIRIRGAGVKVGFDAMILEGTLAVLPNDPMGLLYRLTDAKPSR